MCEGVGVGGMEIGGRRMAGFDRLLGKREGGLGNYGRKGEIEDGGGEDKLKIDEVGNIRKLGELLRLSRGVWPG